MAYNHLNRTWTHNQWSNLMRVQEECELLSKAYLRAYGALAKISDSRSFFLRLLQSDFLDFGLTNPIAKRFVEASPNIDATHFKKLSEKT